jgi:hypothetical protein
MTDVVSIAMGTTSYRDASAVLWGEAGTYCHDSYQRWLPLFGELPETLPIVIGITAYGHCIGLSRITWTHGPRITIASNQFWRGGGAVDDVMVHEMLHCWLYLTGQDTAHKGAAWYAAINRLSPDVLGHQLDVRRGGNRKSVRIKQSDGSSRVHKVRVPDATPHGDVARWPGSFRPAGYDLGAPIGCPSY